MKKVYFGFGILVGFCSLFFIAASYSPRISGSLPTSITQFLGLPSARGLSKDVWVGIRTDNPTSPAGTSEDPLDASGTGTNLSTILTNATTNTVLHLTAGSFNMHSVNIGATGLQIIGAGKDRTILVNVDNGGLMIQNFADRVTLQDLTLFGQGSNRSVVTSSAIGQTGFYSYGNNITVRNVRVYDMQGVSEIFPIGLAAYRPSVAPQGTTGAATWTYSIVAKDAAATVLASTSYSTTTGNATLTGTNFNFITWRDLSGAATYDIYRTAHGTSPATNGLIAQNIVQADVHSFNDTGLTTINSNSPPASTSRNVGDSYGMLVEGCEVDHSTGAMTGIIMGGDPNGTPRLIGQGTERNNFVHDCLGGIGLGMASSQVDCYGNKTDNCLYGFNRDTGGGLNNRIHDNTFLNCKQYGLTYVSDSGGTDSPPDASDQDEIYNNFVTVTGERSDSKGINVSGLSLTNTTVNRNTVIVHGAQASTYVSISIHTGAGLTAQGNYTSSNSTPTITPQGTVVALSNYKVDGTPWGVVGPAISIKSETLTSDWNIGSGVQGQIFIQGATDANRQVGIGYDTANDRTTIQSVHQGSAFTPIILNPLGGAVIAGQRMVVGQTTDPGSTLITGGDMEIRDGGTLGTTASRFFFNGGIEYHDLGSGGVVQIRTTAGSNVSALYASGGANFGGSGDPGAGTIKSNNATYLIRSGTTWTNNAGAAAGTLTNAPAAGNPTKWIRVDDNGTARYIPAW